MKKGVDLDRTLGIVKSAPEGNFTCIEVFLNQSPLIIIFSTVGITMSNSKFIIT